jgi:hypothetical protein
MTIREIKLRLNNRIKRQKQIMEFHSDPDNDNGAGTLSEPYIQAGAKIVAYEDALEIIGKLEK